MSSGHAPLIFANRKLIHLNERLRVLNLERVPPVQVKLISAVIMLLMEFLERLLGKIKSQKLKPVLR
jgi:hypothetical protein